MPNKRSYLLVMYPLNKPKMVSFAIQKYIDEDGAKVLLQQDAATVYGKDPKGIETKYKVIEKRLFEYTNLDGSKTLIIIADVKKEI